MEFHRSDVKCHVVALAKSSGPGLMPRGNAANVGGLACHVEMRLTIARQDFAEALHWARKALQEGEKLAASELFLDASHIDPASAERLLARGLILLELNCRDAAEACFVAALEREPLHRQAGDADALASLAETLREHQDLAAAQQVLDQLTELRPTALRTLLERAYLARARGRGAAARDWFARAHAGQSIKLAA
jgi:tetratricopeptide (TPR) repeat protein